MNEHMRPEQALEQARQWEAASAVCGIAALVLLVAGGPLSTYLSPLLGVVDALLRAAFVLLPATWIGVMAYCSSRADEQRCVASGQKHWRQQKQQRAQELARAEAYLSTKRR